jgi:type II restriction enzyme
LDTFEKALDDTVFQEVTGITLAQFATLRDVHQFFDEVVFNESVQTFLRKKEALSDYFEAKDEDIFDYIPPQQTNQIFTPKAVVKRMVDKMVEHDPLIFEDSNKTFIDLYMKSGLYITEVVKRLYGSAGLKGAFPDDFDRLKHILENQVYGFAPSEIIYKIATNYIFGRYDSISHKNFKMVDTTPFAKEGKLAELVEESFRRK